MSTQNSLGGSKTATQSFLRPSLLPLYVAVSSALSIASGAQAESDSVDQKDVVAEVVVTASLKPESAAKAPAFSNVFSAEDLATAPVNSLADFLDGAVGLSNQADSSGRDELRIRGLGGEYTLVLVNGKRVSSSGALWRGGDFDLNSVPFSSIERVEVIRGPMSSIYGADAIGGVINIITKAPEPEWQGDISTEYRMIESGEGGDQYRIGASARGGLTDTLSLALAAERQYQAPWYADEESDSVAPDREGKGSTNATSTLRWDYSDSQFVEFDLNRNIDSRPFALYSGTASREQRVARTDMGINWQGSWDQWSANAFVKNESSDIEDYNSRYDVPQHYLEENNLYAKAWASWEGLEWRFLTGLDMRNQNIKDEETYLESGEYNVTNQAWFGQAEWQTTEDFSLTAGARLDDHEIFGQHLSPKAYAVYQLSDGITVKGGVSQAFKAPDGSKLSEEYSVLSCGGSCYLAGNPDLEPETSVNYEAGIDVIEGNWDMTAVLFLNEVDELIERQITYTNGSATAAEWINVSEANTKGLELEGSYDLSPEIALAANYTRLIGSYKDTDGNKVVLEDRPEHELAMTAEWNPTDGFNARLQMSRKAGMKRLSGTDELTLPSYYLWDLSMASQLADEWRLHYGVKNLTDVQLTEMSSDYESSLLGRSLYLGARYSF